MDKKTVYGINKSKEVADQQNKSYLGRSFDRHFEGFTYHTELTSDGKEHIVRTYTGNYYEAEQSIKIRIVRAVSYLVLYGFSLVLLVLYSQCSKHSAKVRFLALPEMLTLFAMLWTGVKLIFYITSPKKMTIGEYKSSCIALKSAAKCAAAFWAMNAVLLLLAAIISKNAIRTWILPFVLLWLGCTAMTLIFYLEKHVRYEITPSV